MKTTVIYCSESHGYISSILWENGLYKISTAEKEYAEVYSYEEAEELAGFFGKGFFLENK